MASSTRICAIESLGGVSVGSPRNTAPQNASSWNSYVGLRVNFSVREPLLVLTRMRCQICGLVGLMTCNDPRSPMTRAYVCTAQRDHIEHVIRAVAPDGNDSSARMARSTS